MIFVADKSVDKPIVDYLRKERYEIASISEEKPGISDDYTERKKSIMEEETPARERSKETEKEGVFLQRRCNECMERI